MVQVRECFNSAAAPRRRCSELPPLVLRDITDDEACVDELRMTFRFFASVLVRRAQKVRPLLSCLLSFIHQTDMRASALRPAIRLPLMLLRVFLQVDVPVVFADKVMKAAMKHIEIIAKARGKGANIVTVCSR